MNTSDIKVTNGIGGPAYDPYSWTEYSTEKYKLHLGLDVWLKIPDGSTVRPSDFVGIGYSTAERWLIDAFETFTGVKLEDVDEYQEHALYKAMDETCTVLWPGTSA